MSPDLNALFPKGRIGKPTSTFDADAFLRSAGAGRTLATYQPHEVHFLLR
jgi:hypothetical protein